jgi:drug/metabolite transporter (DMT)-like permease
MDRGRQGSTVSEETIVAAPTGTRHTAAPGQRQAELGLLFLTVIWGTTFITTRLALNDVTPLMLLGMRFAIGFVVLFVLFFRRMLRVNRRDVIAGVVLGILFFIGNVLQTTGLKYTSAGISGFITAMSVVMVPVFAGAILHEKARPSAVIGIVLATIGLALLSLNGSVGMGLGDLLTLGCAVAFAFHIVYTTKYGPRTEPVVIVAIQLLIGTVASFGLVALTETVPVLTQSAIMAAIYLGLMATAFAFVMQVYGQRKTTATRAALIYTMEPVFAAFFAYVIAGETLGERGILGCVLILVGMVVAELL